MDNEEDPTEVEADRTLNAETTKNKKEKKENGVSESEKDLKERKEGPPVPRNEISDILREHEDELIKTIQGVFAEEIKWKDSNLDFRKSFEFKDKLRIKLNIQWLYIEQFYKVTFCASSLFETKEQPAHNYATVSFVNHVGKDKTLEVVKELLQLIHESLEHPLRSTIPLSSLPALANHFVILNNADGKRYSHHGLFCSACDFHIKNTLHIIEHLRNKDHWYFAKRLSNRQSLQGYRRYMNAPHVHFCEQAIGAEINNKIVTIAEYDNFWKVLYPDDMIYKITCDLKEAFPEFTFDVLPFGGFHSLHNTRDYTVDLYITLPNTKDVRERLQKFFTHSQPLLDFEFPSYLSHFQWRNKTVDVYYTLDPRALTAHKTSEFIRILAMMNHGFRLLANLLRFWAREMKVCSSRCDRGISGHTFDLMTIFFLQKCRGLPVFNEETLGMPFLEFIELTYGEKVEKLKPILAPYFAQLKSIPFVKLFFDMILFYAAEFDMKEIVQIIQTEPLYKDKKEVRMLRVQEPATGNSMIQTRPEIESYLHSMLYYAAVHLLQYSVNKKLVALEYQYNLNRKRQRIPFIFPASKNARQNHLIHLRFQPHGAWELNTKIKPPFLPCDFCNEHHLERECKTLKLNPVHLYVPEPVFEKFTQILGDEYDAKKVTQERLEKLNKFTADLQEKLRTELNEPSIRLDPFGSLLSGFGSNTSDLDMCLRLEADEYNEELEDKGNLLLRDIHQILAQSHDYENLRLVSGAKVPIVTFEDKENKIEVDISFYNCLALHNTELLCEYSNFDPRVAALGVAVKAWAKCFDLNDASVGTMSSYALTVMVINYLQRVEPPVLPILQDPASCPEVAYLDPVKVGDWDVLFYKPTEDFKHNFRKNNASLGELFSGFFDYYVDVFEFDHDVIQIRQQKIMSKVDKQWCRNLLTVEDPFELSHNLTAGVKRVTGLYIFHAMNIMQEVLRTTAFLEDFTLDLLSQYAPRTNGNVGNACFHCKDRGHNQNQCPKRAEEQKERRKAHFERKEREERRNKADEEKIKRLTENFQHATFHGRGKTTGTAQNQHQKPYMKQHQTPWKKPQEYQKSNRGGFPFKSPNPKLESPWYNPNANGSAAGISDNQSNGRQRVLSTTTQSEMGDSVALSKKNSSRSRKKNKFKEMKEVNEAPTSSKASTKSDAPSTSSASKPPTPPSVSPKKKEQPTSSTTSTTGSISGQMRDQSISKKKKKSIMSN